VRHRRETHSAGNEPTTCRWGNSTTARQSFRARVDSAMGINIVTNDHGYTYRANVDRGIYKIEELVHTRHNDCPNQTDDPNSECGRRHCGIIGVGNRGSDFSIWLLIVSHKCHDVQIGIVEIIDGEVLCASMWVSNTGEAEHRDILRTSAWAWCFGDGFPRSIDLIWSTWAREWGGIERGITRIKKGASCYGDL
jgi:hypothetical protein